ncbi:DUF1211 domain-containing protein [Mucilaginibacter terrigena]|uniref:DUF1211 domain-containing protein n=1 Tax=Mucilaginibacter terrigena TaxID=2492395 RepID=A0A4Q5LQF7_9SPHI|nr:TMEM175 family protein [Mucilaginibacter terrigena]RYU91579.1 DUF1211 domain-containing protein [Mucilaginibacter terrigena]
MNIKEEEGIKREFQLERVILFSDAVFAIIITIMVLEIKLPEGLRHAGSEKIREAFLELIPKLLGYITAFFFVGMFWSKHLKLFSYLKDYTNTLIVYNLIFLFFISLFPFAVSIMTGTLSPSNPTGLMVYFFVIGFSMLSQTLLAGYLVRNAQSICYNSNEIEKNLQWKAQRINFVLLPLLFIYLGICLYMNVRPEVYGIGFVLWGLTLTRLRRKYYKGESGDVPLIARLFRSRKRKKIPAEDTD